MTSTIDLLRQYAAQEPGAREQALIRRLDNSTSVEALRTHVVEDFLNKHFTNIPVPTGLAGGDTARQQGRYATTGGGAAVGYRRPSSRQPEPFDVRARMVEQINESNAAAGRHLADLSTASNPDAWPSSQEAAQDRATEHIASGMNIGGLTAWHGTPHNFGPRPAFDATKIGSGEGAQAFGYGHYMAGDKAIANHYAEVLTQKLADEGGQRIGPTRQVFDISNPSHVAADYLSNLSDYGKKMYPTAQAQRQYAVEELQRQALDPKGFAASYPKGVPQPDPYVVKEAISLLRGGKPLPEVWTPEPNLYKIDVPDVHIDKMLDWDKPMGAFPETMQKMGASRSRDLRYWSGPLERFMQGGDLMEKLGSSLGPEKAASVLREAGVPGIKFLDANSRGTGFSGSSNYVLFPGNEGLATFLEHNGVPINPNSWGTP